MRYWQSPHLRWIVIAAFFAIALGSTESLQAQSVRVSLGQFGGTVTLVETEPGQFTWNGAPAFHGLTITAANGNTYVLTLSDGRWSGQYVQRYIRLPLGNTGSAITITQRENGQYWWGGPLATGLTITDADGSVYRLTLAAGAWSAIYVPGVVSIRLGQSGELVQIVRLQDGSYSYNGERVQEGLQVQDSTGKVYEFVMRDGMWQANPVSVTPPGPPGGPGPSPVIYSDTRETYVGVEPVLKTGEDGTRRSLIEIGGVEYSVGALFANGSVAATRTFVDHAVEAIETVRGRIETFAALPGIDPETLRGPYGENWDRARDALEDLFGQDGARGIVGDVPTDRRNAVDTDAMLETLDDVLLALSSFQNFHQAVNAGVFQGAIDSDRTDEVFDAVQSVSKLEFRTTANTRFGAYLRYERDGGGSLDEDLMLVDGDNGLGAFAYSPLEASRRVELPSRGEATFMGGTVAVSPGGSLETYTGAIELLVRFSSNRVSGLIRDLRNGEGSLWRYGFGDVEAITLPDASLASNASFSVSSGNAGLAYGNIAGGPRPRIVDSDFDGQIVGNGSQAGAAAIGTWNISAASGQDIVLSGAFGAEHQTTSLPVRPVVNDSGEASRTFIGAQPDSNGDIQLGGQDGAGNSIQFAAADLFARGSADSLGELLVSVANNQIERQIRLLDIWLGIGGSNTERNRNNVWENANEAIFTTVFGGDRRARDLLGSSYPTGSRRDSNARSTLVEAADALSSVRSFEDALAAGGIFEDAADVATNSEAMFAVREHHVRVEYRSTDYGRFGVWSRMVSESAAGGPELDSSNPPDAFAYSPLEQTVYSISDRAYPTGGTAYYEGLTLAVEADAQPGFFEGNIGLTVQWGSQVSAATLTSTLRDLREVDTGDPLLYNNAAVEEITFSGMRLSGGGGNLTEINSGSPTARIRYVNAARSSTSWSGSRSFDGRFVGKTSDGPIGVIGTWSLGGSRFAAALNGAYAADLAP